MLYKIRGCLGLLAALHEHNVAGTIGAPQGRHQICSQFSSRFFCYQQLALPVAISLLLSRLCFPQNPPHPSTSHRPSNSSRRARLSAKRLYCFFLDSSTLLPSLYSKALFTACCASLRHLDCGPLTGYLSRFTAGFLTTFRLASEHTHCPSHVSMYKMGREGTTYRPQYGSGQYRPYP